MTESTDAHEMWEELAAGHALHALGPADERRFRLHLADCPRCAAALDDYRLVGAQLGALADTESDEPPAWNRIRDNVVAASPTGVEDLDDRRRPRAFRILAAAAAVVTVTAIGVVGWDTSHGDTGSSPSAAVLAACQAQHGCRVIKLHSQDGNEPAAVTVTGDQIAVVPIALGSAPTGRTYVLWQMPRDGGPVPISQFRATDSPTASTRLPSSYADTTAFAISVERADVSPTRPTQVLAIGPAT